MGSPFPKRLMVWKEKYESVGCSVCEWVYRINETEGSLRDAFQEHICEQHRANEVLPEKA